MEVDDPRLTARAKEILRISQDYAAKIKGSPLRPLYIFIGVVAEGSGVGALVLAELGVTQVRMLEVLKGLVANIDPTSTESKEIDLAIDVERSRQMFKEIVRPDANYIGTEHLLLLALNTRDELLSELLTQLALDRDVIEQELRVLLRTN